MAAVITSTATNAVLRKNANIWHSTMMSKLSSSSVQVLSPVHIVVGGGSSSVRRFGMNVLYSYRHHSTTIAANSNYIQTISRYQKNISRLYARYILELAIASLLVQKAIHSTTQLESDVPTKPSNWLNWERREWSTELYQSLGTSPIQRIYSATKRIVQLCLLVSPLVVLYPLSYLSTKAHDLSWKYSLWGIEQAGPTYIKLIQWATTRQDLFTPEFCSYFGKLRDETVGHTWDETLQIIQEELNIDITNTTTTAAATIAKKTSNSTNDNTSSTSFMRLDPKPIGSGCVAQVYKGVLLQPMNKYPAGTEIAVKVQHPNIFHKVCCDFYIMSKIASLLESIPLLNLQYLSLYDTVIQFRDIMLPQLDLCIERQHLQRFNANFESDADVEFPVPIDATKKILIETFVHGRPILDYITPSTSVQDRKEIAMLGLRTTLKMIFLHDFLHGDLHPGNLLVSGTSGNYKLHLLDCGLVVEMGPEQHINLVKILGAFTRKNGALAGRLMVDTSSTQGKNGRVARSSPHDVELFVKGIEQIILDDTDNNFIEKVGDYITDICYLACRRKVKLEPAFINAALAVEIMEGIATALDPTLIVTTTAMPMVVQAELMHRLPKFHLW